MSLDAGGAPCRRRRLLRRSASASLLFFCSIFVSSFSISFCNSLIPVLSMDTYGSSRQPASPPPRFNPRRSLDGLSHSRPPISSTEYMSGSPSIVSLLLSPPLPSAPRRQVSPVCRFESIRSELHSVVDLLRSSSDTLTSTPPQSLTLPLAVLKAPTHFLIWSHRSHRNGFNTSSLSPTHLWFPLWYRFAIHRCISPSLNRYAASPTIGTIVTLRLTCTTDTTKIYVASFPSYSDKILQSFDHLLGFGLYAEASIVKFSSKATTAQKIHSSSTDGITPLSLVAGSIVQECGFARFSRYYVTAASPLHYAVSSIDGSSHSQLYGPVQECGLASSSCCYVIAAPPSHYAVSSIDGSSQSQPYGAPIPILVAETIVQECGHARFARFYVIVASPSHYAVSSIDGSSQSHLCDFPTGAVIFYGVSRNSCFQNPLVGLFNVDFDLCAFLRTRALGLQVKCLYGSLLSLATSIFRHVFVIFVYQFIVENLSNCNRLSPLGL